MTELATLHRNLVAIRTTRRKVEKLLDNAAIVLEESRKEEARLLQRIETSRERDGLSNRDRDSRGTNDMRLRLLLCAILITISSACTGYVAKDRVVNGRIFQVTHRSYPRICNLEMYNVNIEGRWITFRPEQMDIVWEKIDRQELITVTYHTKDTGFCSLVDEVVAVK